MIIEFCNITIFIIETLASVIYFENKFKRKYSYKITALITGIISFTLYLMQNIKIPIINAAFFIILNFLFLYFCYNSSVKSCVFSILLLTALMIVTEMIVLYTSSIIFGTNLDLCLTDDYIFIIQAMIAKLLYFVLTYILSKFSIKEKQNNDIKAVALLSILPIGSVILMHATIYICIYNNLNNYYKSLLIISNILILISNIIVYYIHELTLKTNQKYTDILLTQQKYDNTVEYYNLLKQQNENTGLLIHDIKKHLNSIRMLSSKNNADIKNYIDNIFDEFNITNFINYCNNPLLNLITYRYYEICKSNGIKFEVNIQNSKLNFMSEPDITALFDNILENAVEAAKQTDEKLIKFSIDIRNTNFMIISVTNSSHINPLTASSGNIVTSKSDPRLHGFGLKSIRRIIKKYDGNLEMSYDDSENTFTSKIIFQVNSHS